MQQQLRNCDSRFLLHIDLEQAIAMVTALAFPPEEKSRTYLQHALLLSIFDSQRIAAEEQQTFLCSSYAQTKRLASNPAEPSPFLPNSWLPSTPHCSNRALASWHFPPIVFFRVTHKPAAAAALHGQDHINIPMSMPPACPGSPWQLLLTHAAAPAFTHLILLSPLFCGWQMALFSSNLQGVVQDGFLPSLHCPFPHLSMWGSLFSGVSSFLTSSPHGLQLGGTDRWEVLWYTADFINTWKFSRRSLPLPYRLPFLILYYLESTCCVQKNLSPNLAIWDQRRECIPKSESSFSLLWQLALGSSTLCWPAAAALSCRQRSARLFTASGIIASIWSSTERPKGNQCSSPRKAVRGNLYTQSDGIWQTVSLQGTLMYKERGW